MASASEDIFNNVKKPDQVMIKEPFRARFYK